MVGYRTLGLRAGGGRSEACRSVALLAVGPTQLGGCRGAGWSAGSSRAGGVVGRQNEGGDRKLPFAPSRTSQKGLVGACDGSRPRGTPKKQFDCPKLCSQAEAAPALHGSPLARYGALRRWTESRLMA